MAKLGEELNGKPVELYAPYAGEAAVLLLDAIAKAGGDRAGVVDALFRTKVRDGILGGFDDLLSTVLAGEYVAFEETADDEWSVRFGPLRLGTYSPSLFAFTEHLTWSPEPP